MNTLVRLGEPIFCLIAQYIEDVKDWKAFYYMCKKTQQWLVKAKPPLLISSHCRSWRGQFTSSPDTSLDFPVLEIWFRDRSIKYFYSYEDRQGGQEIDICERRPRFYNVCGMSIQLLCQQLIDELLAILPAEGLYLDSINDQRYHAIFLTTKSIDAVCNELYDVIDLFNSYQTIIYERKTKLISEIPNTLGDEWWLDE